MTISRDKIEFRDYQKYTINQIVMNPRYGVFLDMGLGKTVSTLYAIKFMVARGWVKKAIVIAPPLVARDGWTDEADRWDVLEGLRVVSVHGTPSQRLKKLSQTADVYILSVFCLDWLIEVTGLINWTYDMLVIDEASLYKNPLTPRYNTLLKIAPRVDRLVLLTGTPSPNSLLDLWGLIYVLDGGKRLGKNYYEYRTTFFHPGAKKGHQVFTWSLNQGAEPVIFDRIKDITFTLKTGDWVDLPELVTKHVEVSLNNKERAAYNQLEEELILELPDGNISAANAAILANKLLQMANGAVYNEDGNIQPIHKRKLDALADIIDSADGSPMLVFVAYQHDFLLIENMLKKKKIRYCQIKDKNAIKEWNTGKLPVLLAHPRSASHGLNLQHGGHRVTWFGLTWSAEAWQQANKRVHRSGQKYTTVLTIIETKGTFDQKVLSRIDSKTNAQDKLISALEVTRREVQRRLDPS